MIEIYKNRFSDAIARTARLGFDLPNEELLKLRLIGELFCTDENRIGLMQHLQQELGNFFGEEREFNAIQACLAAKNSVEEFLGVSAIFTWGGVEHNGTNVFRCNQDDIMQLYNKQLPKEGRLNAYAWLTLPSFEVIDLSYLELLQRREDKVSNAAFTKYIFGDVKEVYGKHHLVYSPMMVGTDSLIKLSQVFENQKQVS